MKVVKDRPKWLEVDVALSGPRLPRGLRCARANGDPSIQVGDPEFDSALSASGEEARVVAALGHRTRQALIQAASGCPHLELADGVLTARVLATDAHRVAERVRQIATWANEMASERHDVHGGALVRNATGDPVAAVRLRNLEVLAWVSPAEPATLGAARHALVDPDPWVRLQAARMCRRVEGLPVLRALLAPGGTGQLTAIALALFTERAPPEEGIPIARSFLGATDREVAASAITALGRLKDSSSVHEICEVSRRQGLEAIAAEALERLGDPSAEPELLALLTTGPEDARIAVVRALARAGTAACVGPLLEAAKGGGEFAETCREVVREVQGRLAGADHGQLSIAGDARSGQISLTARGEEGGEVSLVPEGVKVGSKAG